MYNIINVLNNKGVALYYLGQYGSVNLTKDGSISVNVLF